MLFSKVLFYGGFICFCSMIGEDPVGIKRKSSATIFFSRLFFAGYIRSDLRYRPECGVCPVGTVGQTGLHLELSPDLDKLSFILIDEGENDFWSHANRSSFFRWGFTQFSFVFCRICGKNPSGTKRRSAATIFFSRLFLLVILLIVTAVPM